MNWVVVVESLKDARQKKKKKKKKKKEEISLS